jgi:hypothetical protein
MATKKPAVPKDEKFEKQDIDLFEVLAALDRKDYDYYDKLSYEQQKKIVPYMLTRWISAIKGDAGLQRYYVMSAEQHVNKHLFNEHVYKHPKLQWQMLCATSPGLGKQFHQYIPEIRMKVSKLQDSPTTKEIKDYYTKIYPKADSSDIDDVAKAFVQEHKRKKYFATVYPHLKLEDIELLNTIVTDEQIEQYERDRGN